MHEAKTTLLIAQKVGHVENAFISLEKALDSINLVLKTILKKFANDLRGMR